MAWSWISVWKCVGPDAGLGRVHVADWPAMQTPCLRPAPSDQGNLFDVADVSGGHAALASCAEGWAGGMALQCLGTSIVGYGNRTREACGDMGAVIANCHGAGMLL